VRDGDHAGEAGDPERVSVWGRSGSFGIVNGGSGLNGSALNGPAFGGSAFNGSAFGGSAVAANGFALAAEPTLASAGHAGPAANEPGGRVLPFVARHASGMTSQWPRHSFLELGALDGAVPSARLHARHVLWEWGLADLRDTAELVVSELVTNGVQASRSMAEAAIRLWLFSDLAQVVVLVWDASPRPPERMDVSDDAENGRGLLLVDAVSRQWGWYFPREEDGTPAWDHHGKFVWAIVR
jgi:anti-sigma regulatory factor (Ser/Thr protein kinase)